MFLAQAYMNANDGDFITRQSNDDCGFTKGNTAIDVPGPYIEDSIAEDWIVIKSELIVLRDFEAWEITKSSLSDSNTFMDVHHMGFNDGHANGRLERDLEYKELMESVWSYFVDEKYDNYKNGMELNKYIVRLIGEFKPL